MILSAEDLTQDLSHTSKSFVTELQPWPGERILNLSKMQRFLTMLISTYLTLSYCFGFFSCPCDESTFTKAT